MNDKTYKILAFDFDTKVLDEIYYKGNYRNSYNEFRQFLKENKFEEKKNGNFNGKRCFNRNDNGYDS